MGMGTCPSYRGTCSCPTGVPFAQSTGVPFAQSRYLVLSLNANSGIIHGVSMLSPLSGTRALDFGVSGICYLYRRVCCLSV